MNDLNRLRCASCDTPATLRRDDGGEVRCSQCGDARPLAATMRPYATRTGQWLIGAAALFGWSYGQPPSEIRWIGLAASGAVLGWVLTRIAWQWRALRR